MTTGHYLPLGCYGKLPFWPEFLSEGVKITTASAFKQWLHDGKQGASLSDPGLPVPAGSIPGAARAPAVSRSETSRETAWQRFLFGVPGSLELMAGVVRPSTDQGK